MSVCIQKMIGLVVWIMVGLTLPKEASCTDYADEVPEECYDISDLMNKYSACKLQKDGILHYCFMAEITEYFICDMLTVHSNEKLFVFQIKPNFTTEYSPCPTCDLHTKISPFDTPMWADDFSSGKYIADISDKAIMEINNSFPIFNDDHYCDCQPNSCRCGHLKLQLNLTSFDLNATYNMHMIQPRCTEDGDYFYDALTNNSFSPDEFSDTLCPDCCDCTVCPPNCTDCSEAEKDNSCYQMTEYCFSDSEQTSTVMYTHQNDQSTATISNVEDSQPTGTISNAATPTQASATISEAEASPPTATMSSAENSHPTDTISNAASPTQASATISEAEASKPTATMGNAETPTQASATISEAEASQPTANMSNAENSTDAISNAASSSPISTTAADSQSTLFSQPIVIILSMTVISLISQL